MAGRKATIRDCCGCYNDFYNRTDMGMNMTSNGPRCWGLETAVMVKKFDIPTRMRPPYNGLKPTSRPSCYKREGYSRVSKDVIDKNGYWKPIRLTMNPW
jgi:hypothetical protein